MSNITKMSTLIMENPAFLDSCYKRMETSTSNKLLHDAMIVAIENNDQQHVEEALSNKLYSCNPLFGVILCMDKESEAKWIELYELWEDIREEV